MRRPIRRFGWMLMRAMDSEMVRFSLEIIACRYCMYFLDGMLCVQLHRIG